MEIFPTPGSSANFRHETPFPNLFITAILPSKVKTFHFVNILFVQVAQSHTKDKLTGKAKTFWRLVVYQYTTQQSLSNYDSDRK